MYYNKKVYTTRDKAGKLGEENLKAALGLLSAKQTIELDGEQYRVISYHPVQNSPARYVTFEHIKTSEWIKIESPESFIKEGIGQMGGKYTAITIEEFLEYLFNSLKEEVKQIKYYQSNKDIVDTVIQRVQSEQQ